jgi:hypothetical protein
MTDASNSHAYAVGRLPKKRDKNSTGLHTKLFKITAILKRF